MLDSAAPTALNNRKGSCALILAAIACGLSLVVLSCPSSRIAVSTNRLQ